MADREIQLLDKDDNNIYPLGHNLDDFIYALPDHQDNVHIKDLVGSTSSADGEHGLVPEPKKSSYKKVLQADGTWNSYPLGTVLAVAEYRSRVTCSGTTGSLINVGGTWYLYGPMAGGSTGSSITIAPPADEDWDVLCEMWAPHVLLQYTGSWGGIGLKYSRSGGTSGNFASLIHTMRGISAVNNSAWHTSMKLERYGYCPHGQTTTIIPAYVYDGGLMFYENRPSPSEDWSLGPTFTLAITLINKKKVS